MKSPIRYYYAIDESALLMRYGYHKLYQFFPRENQYIEIFSTYGIPQCNVIGKRKAKKIEKEMVASYILNRLE